MRPHFTRSSFRLAGAILFLTVIAVLGLVLQSSAWRDDEQSATRRARLAAVGDPPVAVRDINDAQPTSVLVALGFTADSTDVVRETLPVGSSIVPDSWQAWQGLFAEPPNPRMPTDSSDVVEVAASFEYDAINRILTVTGSNFEAVTYELSAPIPPLPAEQISGEVERGGMTDPIVEVPSVDGALQGWLDDLDFWSSLTTLINGSTEDWANNVNVASLPVVTIDQDANLMLANAEGDGNGGIGGCTRSGTSTADIAAFLEIDSYPSGLVQGYAWIGTAFLVKGCHPNQNESASGSIEVQNISWEGCLEWDILCAPMAIPPFIVCGAGGAAARITWEVRSWPASGGTISGGGTFEFSIDLRDTGPPPLPFWCPSEPPPASSSQATPTFNLQEDRVYMARLLIQGRSAGYLGGAIVDFQDQADGGCWNQGGSRSGIFYDNLLVNFDLPPLPDMEVNPPDLSFSPNPVISGWPVQVDLTVHNYGTADATDVDVKFLADAEPMCQDLLNPVPSLPLCPTIALLPECNTQQQVHLRWCSTGVGKRGINAIVDPIPPFGVIPEKDETNNTVTDTLVVEPPPVVASLLDLDKSLSMEAQIFPGGPKNIDVERWIANTWVDLNSDPTALAVFNFGANVVHELPLRYMTAAGKTAAHAAVNTTAGVNRGGTALFAAIKEGLDALCCMNGTPIKALVLYTDGGDTVSLDPAQEVAEIILQATCCKVPLIFYVVPPFAFVPPGSDMSTVPGGAQGQYAILQELAQGTGGGLYTVPVAAESTDVAEMVLDGLGSLQMAPGEGVIVSPVRQPGIGTGGTSLTRYAGSINVTVLETGWGAPINLDITTPPLVTFAEIPTIEPSEGISVAGPVELLDGNTRLRVPLDPVAPDPCTIQIGIGGVSGIALTIDGAFPDGDVELGVSDDGLGVINTSVTVARVTSTPTDVEMGPPPPTANRLLQNAPNPFNPMTTLRLELRDGGPASLRVYDVRGQLVRTLVNEHMPVGRHNVLWNGTDDWGRDVPTGIYFARVVVRDFKQEVRMTLLR